MSCLPSLQGMLITAPVEQIETSATLPTGLLMTENAGVQQTCVQLAL